MMFMKKPIRRVVAMVLTATFGVLCSVATGCAGDAADEGDSEEAAATQDELNSNATRLVGAYAISSESMRPPNFEGIVLQRDGSFFADVDTGIRCVRSPCPSQVRLSGKFTATKNYLRLIPAAGEQSPHYGRYRYTLSTDGLLSLSRPNAGSAGWSNTLDKSPSYCQAAEDCGGQGLVHPMCVGQWTCSEARTCGYQCGGPAMNAIWPDDAKRVVAESSGGGFVQGQPSGSTCAIGAQKFVLDLSSRKLSYSECELVNSQTSLTMVSREKTLTAAQMAKVDAAMDQVTFSTRQNCGADKPLLTITVTSPSQGEKTFKDSFNACTGDGPFIDHIDEVFEAFYDIVED